MIHRKRILQSDLQRLVNESAPLLDPLFYPIIGQPTGKPDRKSRLPVNKNAGIRIGGKSLDGEQKATLEKCNSVDITFSRIDQYQMAQVEDCFGIKITKEQTEIIRGAGALVNDTGAVIEENSSKKYPLKSKHKNSRKRKVKKRFKEIDGEIVNAFFKDLLDIEEYLYALPPGLRPIRKAFKEIREGCTNISRNDPVAQMYCDLVLLIDVIEPYANRPHSRRIDKGALLTSHIEFPPVDETQKLLREFIDKVTLLSEHAKLCDGLCKTIEPIAELSVTKIVNKLAVISKNCERWLSDLKNAQSKNQNLIDSHNPSWSILVLYTELIKENKKLEQRLSERGCVEGLALEEKFDHQQEGQEIFTKFLEDNFVKKNFIDRIESAGVMPKLYHLDLLSQFICDAYRLYLNWTVQPHRNTHTTQTKGFRQMLKVLFECVGYEPPSSRELNSRTRVCVEFVDLQLRYGFAALGNNEHDFYKSQYLELGFFIDSPQGFDLVIYEQKPIN